MGCSGQEPHLTGGSVGGNTWLEKGRSRTGESSRQAREKASCCRERSPGKLRRWPVTQTAKYLEWQGVGLPGILSIRQGEDHMVQMVRWKEKVPDPGRLQDSWEHGSWAGGRTERV